MKILFTDSWTRGVHNFVPVAKELGRRGVASLLVHRGSWGTQPDRPMEELVDGVLCRDMRYYQTQLIHRMLLKEAPDVVLMLNTNYIFNRATILAARSLRIQSTFLMHGLLDVDRGAAAMESAVGPELRSKRWRRAAKYLRYVLPNYFYSGFRQDPLFPVRLGPYSVVWNTFRRPEQYLFYPPPSPELQCDRALVWARVFAAHVQRTYGYPPERTVVIGHPPLDSVFRLLASPPSDEQRAELLGALRIPRGRRVSVFLESPFLEEGVTGWTRERRLVLYREFVEAAGRAGVLLVIKLHPSSTFGEAEFSGDERVRVVKSANLPLLLYLAESAIGYISTTVAIALALRKPVFMPGWGPSLAELDFYAKHGVVRTCNSPGELADALKTPSLGWLDPERHARFIEDYLAPTDGLSVSRIADNLMEQAELTRSGRRVSPPA